MTKIKNTKKGMAKKTLSISLVAAMLATSNVPVWATEFSDGSDTSVFTSEEAPVLDDTVKVLSAGNGKEPQVATSVGTESDMVTIEGSVSVSTIASYGSTITPDYTAIKHDGYTLRYQWQRRDKSNPAWENITNAKTATYQATKDDVNKEIRVIAYATKDNAANTEITSTDLLSAYGKASEAIKVNPKAVASSDITVTVNASKEYDAGKEITLQTSDLTVKVKDGGTDVTVNAYEITGYKNNTNIGTAEVTITLKDESGYSGFGTGTFEITGDIQATWTLEFPEDAAKNEYTYTGKDIVPTNVTVKLNNQTVLSPEFYDILPLEGKNVGSYNVKVVGKGTYAGSYKETNDTPVKIVPKKVDSLRVVVTPATTGVPTKVEVFDDSIDPNTPLVGVDATSTDYNTKKTTADYQYTLVNDGVAGAPAYVKIEAISKDVAATKGNYTGTRTVDYSNANVDISAIGSFKTAIENHANTWNTSATFDGTQKNPITKGMILGNLIEGRDFTATVTDGGINAGKLTVVFEGKGYYTGKVTSYDFIISPITLDSTKVGSDFSITYGKLTYDPNKGDGTGTTDDDKKAFAKYKDDIADPVIKIKSTGYVLVKGKDYNYELAELAGSTDKGFKMTITPAVGSKNVTVSADNQITNDYKLAAKNIADADVTVTAIPTQAFIGTAVTPEVELTYKGITYVSDKKYEELQKASLNGQTVPENYKKLSDEFTITYANNTAIGENTASVTITATTTSTTKKHYTGKKVVKFSIGNATLEGGSIVNSVDGKTDLPSVGYDKTAAESKDGIILPADKYHVMNKDGQRVDPKYYDVTYSNNKAVGTATITITGKNGYSGVLTNTYTIAQNSLPVDSLTITTAAIDYTGSEITLVKDRDFTVTGALAKLTYGTDYTLKYENNINAGTAKVIVQGINSYYGNFSKTFNILPVTIGANDIEVGDSGYAGGKAVEPKVAIKVPGTGNLLKEGTDYTVKYTPAAYNVGDTVTIDITYNTNDKIAPVNVNQASVARKTVKVTAKDLKNVTISEIADQEVTGEQIKPAITVKNGDVTMTEGKDFEVVYGTNTEIGEGTVTIKALDSNKNYVGEQTVKFNITKKKSEVGQALIKTVNVDGNTAEVVLEGSVEGAEGYDYVIATEEDYKNGRVDIIKNQVAISTDDFRYVPKGTYYAYCHAWKRGEDGKKEFGDWSKLFKFEVASTTPATPKVTGVKVNGSTVTVTYTECKGATGYDVVLGTRMKKVNGENRPVNYGTLVKKNIKDGVVTATFKNVPKGTYYAGLHAFNRTAADGTKVFSKWSNAKTVTVK